MVSETLGLQQEEVPKAKEVHRIGIINFTFVNPISIVFLLNCNCIKP